MDQLSKKVDEALARLATIERLVKEGGAGAGGAAPEAGDEKALSPAITAWDDMVDEFFGPLSNAVAAIGGDAATAFAKFVNTKDLCRAFVKMASESKKPSDADMPNLLKPLSVSLASVQEFRDKNRRSKQFNHLCILYETVPAFAWVSVAPAPSPFVTSMLEAGDFYMNKILREFRGKDENQVNFVKHLKSFLSELATYVKKYHTTGVAWNMRGGAAFVPGGDEGGAPPAPGPPPPPPVLTAADVGGAPKKAAAGGGMADVFGQINKGGAVTSGLKKVTPDLKTKNRPLSERTSVVPAKTAAKPAAKTAAPAAKRVRPPVFELSGKKWLVENQVGNKSIVIEDTNVKQVVYICGCQDSVIQIKGKVNVITLDGCKKTGVVFEDVVSSVEVVNCQRVQVQTTGLMPTASVEKTTGCAIFVSEASMGIEIVTSCSSELNVTFPKSDSYGTSGDVVESAVCEQFKTVIVNGALVTSALTHV